MYILLCQVPLETVLYCTVISSFISIPQLGLKVLCEWILVLLCSMINIFEKLIVWEIKLINYQLLKHWKLQKSMSDLLTQKKWVIGWSNIWIPNDMFLLNQGDLSIFEVFQLFKYFGDFVTVTTRQL